MDWEINHHMIEFRAGIVNLKQKKHGKGFSYIGTILYIAT